MQAIETTAMTLHTQNKSRALRQTKHDDNEITNTQQGTTRKKRAFTNNTSAMGFYLLS